MGSISPREWAVLGVVQSIIVKNWESLLRCTVPNKRDHSVLNNGTTCDAAFRQNSLTTCNLLIFVDFSLGFYWQADMPTG